MILKKAHAVRFQYFALIGLAILGFVLILYSTRWGVGLGDDSFAYLRPAMNFLAGRPTDFDPSFPPALPSILFIFSKLGFDPVESFRYLNAVLFGANIFIFGSLIFQSVNSNLFSLLGSLILLASSMVIRIHSEALSEPLYIFFTLLSTTTISLHLRYNQWYWLLGTAFLSAMAFATRYLGVVVVGSVTLILLFNKQQNWRRRIRDILFTLFMGIIIIGTYLYRNLMQFGALTTHGQFRIDIIQFLPSRAGIYNMLIWFVPGRLVKGYEYEVLIFIGLSVIISLLALFIFRRRILLRFIHDIFSNPTTQFIFFLSLSSFLVLLMAEGFINMGDTFNERYVISIYFPVLYLLILIIGKAYHSHQKLLHIFASASYFILLFLFGYRAIQIIDYLHNEGVGYTSRRWHYSETLAYLETHPDIPLISTAPNGVNYWLNRDVKPFSTNLTLLKQDMCENGAWLVIIDSMPPEFYGISYDELTEDLSLIQMFGEGSIYACDENS